MKLLFLSVAALLCLCGCSTGAPGAFYRAGSYSPKEKVKDHIPVIDSGNLDSDVRRYQEQYGYRVIGTSDYRGEPADINGFSRQARKVNASVVLFSQTQVGTRSGVRTVSVPRTDTATANTQGNVYGSHGQWAQYSEHTTMTIEGQDHYIVPYTVAVFEVHGVYLAK